MSCRTRRRGALAGVFVDMFSITFVCPVESVWLSFGQNPDRIGSGTGEVVSGPGGQRPRRTKRQKIPGITSSDMSANGSSCSAEKSAQRCASQISIRSMAPTTTQSRSSCAHSRRTGGTEMRPCFSGNSDEAPLKSMRRKLRLTLFVKGVVRTRSVNSLKLSGVHPKMQFSWPRVSTCLLYTSDAADDLTRVDLGVRRIIKKKKNYIHFI